MTRRYTLGSVPARVAAVVASVVANRPDSGGQRRTFPDIPHDAPTEPNAPEMAKTRKKRQPHEAKP